MSTRDSSTRSQSIRRAVAVVGGTALVAAPAATANASTARSEIKKGTSTESTQVFGTEQLSRRIQADAAVAYSSPTRFRDKYSGRYVAVTSEKGDDYTIITGRAHLSYTATITTHARRDYVSVGLVVKETSAWGKALGGSFVISVGCKGSNCRASDIGTAATGVRPGDVIRDPDGRIYSRGGGVDSFGARIVSQFEGTAGGPPANERFTASHTLRCDSAFKQFGRTIRGCVVPSHSPTYHVSVARTPDVAENVENALGYHPSFAWARRTTDAHTIAVHRAKATALCRRLFGKRPSGRQCDEFPAASTVPYYRADRAYNPNVLYVRSRQNAIDGGLRGAFYLENHVLNGDLFKTVVGINYDGNVAADKPAIVDHSVTSTQLSQSAQASLELSIGL